MVKPNKEDTWRSLVSPTDRDCYNCKHRMRGYEWCDEYDRIELPKESNFRQVCTTFDEVDVTEDYQLIDRWEWDGETK